jgi:membrane protease YdiL (CAAX protease family)
MGVVGAISPATEMKSAGVMRQYAPWVTALELAVVFACILLYIWRWQSTHRFLWIALLAFIILSHIFHRDSPRAMGLTLSGFRPAAAIIFPLAATIYVPVIAVALATHHLVLQWPQASILHRFAGYGIWCCFQQYLVQCYFHRRLMSIFKKPHLSCAIVSIMFSVAHIPNPVLIVATLAGGFILAEVYERHPNIWPLGLAQAVGGLLIGTLVPASLIHNMRVGPGYYTYRR